MLALIPQELLLYLLQLVQALRFDSTSTAPTKPQRRRQSVTAPAEPDSGLSDFLIARGAANPVFGTSLFWYLMIEVVDNSAISKMYAKVADGFMRKLESTPEGTAQRQVLKRQAELVDLLSTRAKDVRASKDARSKKIEKLRHWLGDGKHGLSPLPSPLPLPLNARISVTSVTADKSTVFKSNLVPLLLWFETTDTSPNRLDEEGFDAEAPAIITPDYPVIFKNGDDLRQDQLVLQLFSLMDRLLRRENLNLRLLPYSVLATSRDEGMIQFVPSKSLAAIMAEHGSLQNYLRLDHADDGALGSYGIEAGVMDTFIRSCGEADHLSLFDSDKNQADDSSWLLGPDLRPRCRR